MDDLDRMLMLMLPLASLIFYDPVCRAVSLQAVLPSHHVSSGKVKNMNYSGKKHENDTTMIPKKQGYCVKGK